MSPITGLRGARTPLVSVGCGDSELSGINAAFEFNAHFAGGTVRRIAFVKINVSLHAVNFDWRFELDEFELAIGRAAMVLEVIAFGGTRVFEKQSFGVATGAGV